MSFEQVNEITINIGLKNEYKIVHFSDTHAMVYNDSDTPEEIAKAKDLEERWFDTRKGFASYFKEYCGEEQMIPASKCLDNLINYVNVEKPIAVVMTGDIIDYYSKSNYEYLMDECGKLNYPFIFTCGNHESPVEQYEEITNTSNGFMVIELNDFKLVGLDDSKRQISKETLKNFKDELRSKKPVIICMHVPVMTPNNKEAMSKYDSYFTIDYENTDETTKEFVEILMNNEKVKAVLCGHTHGMGESELVPGKKQYCASSGLIGFVNKITIK